MSKILGLTGGYDYAKLLEEVEKTQLKRKCTIA